MIPINRDKCNINFIKKEELTNEKKLVSNNRAKNIKKRKLIIDKIINGSNKEIKISDLSFTKKIMENVLIN